MNWVEKFYYFLMPIFIVIAAWLAAYIATRNIRIAAKKERGIFFTKKMYAYLVETVKHLDKILNLFIGFANRLSWRSIQTKEITAYAYDRYWEGIEETARQFNDLETIRKLTFPTDLYNLLTSMVNDIREANECVKEFDTRDDWLNSDGKTLESMLQITRKTYVKYNQFIGLGRE